MDTIYALATARGKAGVAVVRISGPLAFLAVEKLAGDVPSPRRTALRVLKNSEGIVLDEALVICFEKGASFTGEESAELQLHGSVAIINAVLQSLSEIEGLRLAEAGEFTRRALENERLDLAQVEGLADLIEAETEAQRRQALKVFSGALGDKAERWRSSLLRAAALIEATIDFADEEVPTDVSPEVLDLISRTMTELEEEIAGSKMAERIRDGFEVAIVGPPNAGKSTLLNALAGREAAITSEFAGTTRDIIEVRMDLKGLPVTLLDTAGLRETSDVVEAIGIDRARNRAAQADLRVILLPSEGADPEMPPQEGDLVLVGKDDQGALSNSVSGKTGHGIDAMVSHIALTLSERASDASTAIRERHRIAIQDALVSMESARNEVLIGADRAELAAEELRRAVYALNCLVGRIDVENILGEIFSSFCIGK
ncbi:tRNA uridine-5-carboxymethylaminomethyl(34) synthesis GTPase MnmE [Celeribacter halophilus]|uniref:tRNA uridine-5-carboxymethylaminomethyl(34) synthesis GTPase MnmE n=1 Tax=Celeribacter halophilus TaxID=576117 RepID=UPI001C08541A|nr:tRNA uridine-5-carboxymethylaminomethyl(34) synthesis GTPase MnmE [Celeribacter halophilus]MBU2889673.1 tRNA uridine-5-carboxymethylaminomethyl(34) synthesis GTPase MnmE [Celeribacter halophilus]MDO6510684.1 tRNA uridine-5-carboxymethylaminomethyl(34) synthesis GTPase MnmE [Celeribacter halophilus]